MSDIPLETPRTLNVNKINFFHSHSLLFLTIFLIHFSEIQSIYKDTRSTNSKDIQNITSL